MACRRKTGMAESGSVSKAGSCVFLVVEMGGIGGVVDGVHRDGAERSHAKETVFRGKKAKGNPCVRECICR